MGRIFFKRGNLILRNILVTLMVLFCVDVVSAQSNFSYTGFSGGMMIHSGYVFDKTVGFSLADGATINKNIGAVPFGVGGVARVHLGNFLRVGIEGYGSTANYDELGSYTSIGWGGVLVDAIWQNKSIFAPFAGITVGGGAQQHIAILEENPLDFDADRQMSYRKYGFALISPFIGVEIRLKDNLRLIAKADYVTNVSNKQLDFAKGIRVYFGIVFYRSKK